MQKKIVRLNTKELMKAQIDYEIKTDAELAQKIGISASQICRAKLNPNDRRHSAPGNQFIAGVLSVFGGPFDKFFYIDELGELIANADSKSG
jgi:hypothetical protein